MTGICRVLAVVQLCPLPRRGFPQRVHSIQLNKSASFSGSDRSDKSQVEWTLACVALFPRVRIANASVTFHNIHLPAETPRLLGEAFLV